MLPAARQGHAFYFKEVIHLGTATFHKQLLDQQVAYLSISGRVEEGGGCRILCIDVVERFHPLLSLISVRRYIICFMCALTSSAKLEGMSWLPRYIFPEKKEPVFSCVWPSRPPSCPPLSSNSSQLQIRYRRLRRLPTAINYADTNSMRSKRQWYGKSV